MNSDSIVLGIKLKIWVNLIPTSHFEYLNYGFFNTDYGWCDSLMRKNKHSLVPAPQI